MRKRAAKRWYEVGNLRQINAVHAAWGKGIEAQPWDLFGAFTFRRKTRCPKKAKRRFRWFVRTLCKRIKFFAFFEMHASGESIHIHALLGDTGTLKPRVAADAWNKKYGFAHVVVYQKHRGAGFYISKHVNKESTDWDTNLPDLSYTGQGG